MGIMRRIRPLWILLGFAVGSSACGTDRTTCTACFVGEADPGTCPRWTTDGELGPTQSPEITMRNLCTGRGRHGAERTVPPEHRAACDAVLAALESEPRGEGGALVQPPQVPTEHIELTCTHARVHPGPSCVAH